MSVADVSRNALESSPGHRIRAGIDQGDLPRFRLRLVDLHRVLLKGRS